MIFVELFGNRLIVNFAWQYKHAPSLSVVISAVLGRGGKFPKQIRPQDGQTRLVIPGGRWLMSMTAGSATAAVTVVLSAFFSLEVCNVSNLSTSASSVYCS